MGGECGTCGRDRYVKQVSDGEMGKKETTWEILGVDGMLILIYLKEWEWDDADYIYLAQDKDEGWVYVNIVMTFQVPYNVENFFSSWGSVSFPRRTLVLWFCLLVHNRTTIFSVKRDVCLHWWNCVWKSKDDILLVQLALYCKDWKYLLFGCLSQIMIWVWLILNTVSFRDVLMWKTIWV